MSMAKNILIIYKINTMKKITLLLTLIGILTLQSCCKNEEARPTSEVFQYANVNFLPNAYSVVLTYPHNIVDTDMVLVYRLSGSFNGENIWKLLPETYYFADGTLDLRYDFDFTRFDAEVRLEGFDLSNVTDAYKLNQTLRVVTIPANFGKNSNFNYKDYKAVVKAYEIDESKIFQME